MISAMDIRNSENSHSHSTQASKLSSTSKDKLKSHAPAGLTVRKTNTNHTNTPLTSCKPKARVKAVQREEENIEFMPSLLPEEDDYADIMSFDERPTTEKLKQILQLPMKTEKDSFNIDSLLARVRKFEDVDIDAVAKEITEDFKPCSLSDIPTGEGMN